MNLEIGVNETFHLTKPFFMDHTLLPPASVGLRTPHRHAKMASWRKARERDADAKAAHKHPKRPYSL